MLGTPLAVERPSAGPVVFPNVSEALMGRRPGQTAAYLPPARKLPPFVKQSPLYNRI
jgi:hypothetical protein